MGIILVRHLFRCLAYYLVGMFIFLLLSLESSLYNMVLSSLSDVCFQMFCLDLCIFQCVSFHPLFSDDDGIINSMDIRFSKLQETWRAASWVARIWTQFRNWTTVQLLSHVLLFVIPWTEDPGEQWSIRSQRGGHDWSKLAHMHTRLFPSLLLFTFLLYLISLPSEMQGYMKVLWGSVQFSHSVVSDSLRPHGFPAHY